MFFLSSELFLQQFLVRKIFKIICYEKEGIQKHRLFK